MTGSRQQSHSWGTKREALDPLWNEHRNPACHWYIQVNRDQYCNIYICQCMQLLHDGMAETILSTEWLLCGDATYHPLCKFISQVPTRAPTAAVMAGLVLRRFPVLLHTQLKATKYFVYPQLPNIPHYLAEAYITVTNNLLPWVRDLHSAGLPIGTTEPITSHNESLQVVKWSAIAKQSHCANCGIGCHQLKIETGRYPRPVPPPTANIAQLTVWRTRSIS